MIKLSHNNLNFVISVVVNNVAGLRSGMEKNRSGIPYKQTSRIIFPRDYSTVPVSTFGLKMPKFFVAVGGTESGIRCLFFLTLNPG
jgi:hypothetical protein